MKNLKAYCLLILTLLSINAGAQETPWSLGIWHFRPVSGEISLLGSYRTLSSYFNELEEDLNSRHVQGGIKLNSTSYLWSPDIFSISLGGEFNPGFTDDKYVVIPDRSEVRTLSKFDLYTSLFNNKAISLSSYYNLNSSYYNRENLTNIRSDNSQAGAILTATNRVFPLRISYRDINWEQTETESGRFFSMNQKNLEAGTYISFFDNDKHELKYSLRDYKYRYDNLRDVDNLVNRIDFISQLFFDNNRKYALNSNIYYYDQAGNYTFSRFEISERALAHLPYNLDLTASYRYYKMDDLGQSITINKTRLALKHELFSSLSSRAYIDYTGTAHSAYSERNLISGTQLSYTKKTKIGRFNLAYSFFGHKNNVDGELSAINILREEHILNDLSISIIEKPYVDIPSIIITDLSSTVIYQEGLDYLVNTINNFTEIIRIPGGQITQDQTVLVSYTAVQPGSYSYLAVNNSLSSSILFFDRILELYYRGTAQEYPSVNQTEYLTLNRFYQNIAGFRLHYKIATAGLEYDYYNSEIIPYRRMNYYLNLNIKIKSRILLSLNGTLRDHRILDQDLNYLYSNLSTRFTYSINNWSRLNIEGSYLKQNGRTIELDLLTGKTELTASLRMLTLKGSFNIYRRSYAKSKFFYTGSQLEIIRKF